MHKNAFAESEEGLIRLYLNDIGKYRLLDKDDEVRLAQTAEIGRNARAELLGDSGITAARKRELLRLVSDGDQAVESFVKANLRLVVSIAKKYQTGEMPLLDLVQEGNLGLIHAVDKFDWRKGFKFSTYATWWIRQAITRGIANGSRTVRLPLHAVDLLVSVTAASNHLEEQLGRRATTAELAASLELEEEKVTEILRNAAEPLSLSQPLGEHDPGELGDVVEDHAAVSPFDATATALLSSEVDKLLIMLDDREREILRQRFGLGQSEPLTLDEVGLHLNLSRERIRQIETRAMCKLRHPSAPRPFRDLVTS